MITANAEILITQHYDPKGNLERYTFGWQGPKNGVVAISPFLVNSEAIKTSKKDNLEAGDVVEVGPFKLKVFEVSLMRHTIYCYRVDSLSANLRAYLYRFTRIIELTYRRLIITAAVWNLAHYNGATIPSWKDLYIVQRFKSK